jgi:hypothetical protein
LLNIYCVSDEKNQDYNQAYYHNLIDIVKHLLRK